ncbi:Hint domain-containing protein [Microvirga massiliensis]|uniref:Hint domain-containing protein n=1 Tax=Microvirga massiliensis TaxID=1033741 RepID=UPI0006617C55|nr:Hint domain-containing protein [Microvirga massiliensis]
MALRSGTSDDDILHGTSEGDVIVGGSGDDRLFGHRGDDWLEGGDDNDVLRGGQGSDTLLGGSGDDRLSGHGGNDVLDGGAGDDLIRTGSGFDRVLFSGDDIGDDRIVDFDVNSDKIDLTELTGVESLSDLAFAEVGQDVVITSKNGTFSGSITVKGVTTQQLLDNNAIDVACFVRGTLIRTTRGEMPVESLMMGDEVVTLDGSAHTIKWIGRRTFSTRFVKAASRVVPVLIRAGAIAPGVPCRDLRVSPEHALWVDGVLVPAVNLVNGRTIVRDLNGETIDYYHIELDEQNLILADGAPAETYVNHDSRKMFANWRDYVALYGEDAPAIDEAGRHVRAYPVATAAQCAAIRRRLDERAGVNSAFAA